MVGEGSIGSSNHERAQSDVRDVNKQRQRGHYAHRRVVGVGELLLDSSAVVEEISLSGSFTGPQRPRNERPESQQQQQRLSPEHDDQQRGDPEQPVQLRRQPVRRVHVDGERGGVQQAGGGGAVGGGVHRALLPGDAGGGGAVGVVHPVQRPPLSDHHSAAGADRPHGAGHGRGRGRRPGHRDEQQSQPQRRGVHPGNPETRHVTPPGRAPPLRSSQHCDIVNKMSAVFFSRHSTFSLTCCQSSALASHVFKFRVQLLLVTATLHLYVCPCVCVCEW